MLKRVLKILIVFLFFVCGAAFFFYIFVPSLYMSILSYQRESNDGITKGIIMVTFKSNTSEKDARALLDKYKLKAPPELFKHKFISFYSKDKNLDTYVKKLKYNPLILKAEVTGKDLAKPSVSVDFSRSVSRDEIDNILKQFNNLYLEQDVYDLDVQKIVVPKGKEKYYSDLLNKENIVKKSTVIFGVIWL